MDIMGQSACLVINSIMAYIYFFLFYFMTVGQASRLPKTFICGFVIIIDAYLWLDLLWLNLGFSLVLTVCVSSYYFNFI